jgi:hypothetical protein
LTVIPGSDTWSKAAIRGAVDGYRGGASQLPKSARFTLTSMSLDYLFRARSGRIPEKLGANAGTRYGEQMATLTNPDTRFAAFPERSSVSQAVWGCTGGCTSGQCLRTLPMPCHNYEAGIPFGNGLTAVAHVLLSRFARTRVARPGNRNGSYSRNEGFHADRAAPQPLPIPTWFAPRTAEDRISL